jgi:uncharacterized protein (DUF2062 family)
MPKRKILKMLRPVIEFIEFRVLHIDDSPERIAGGVFAGILIAYTPFLGLHLLIAIAAAMIFRINKFATLSFVWISNVFTLIPIYYPSYVVGRAIMNLFQSQPEMTQRQILRSLNSLIRQIDFNSVFDPDFWSSFWKLFKAIGPELFIGGLIIGTIIGGLAYRITARSIMKHRRKARLKRIRKTGSQAGLEQN